MADAYQTTGGSLRLKGKGIIGNSKKKKKSKSKEIIEYSEKKNDSSGNEQDGDEKKTTTVTKTAAELNIEKVQEQRAAKKLLKKASKTHRQRVEELNNYLGELSEHYDIQKVSWTK